MDGYEVGLTLGVFEAVVAPSVVGGGAGGAAGGRRSVGARPAQETGFGSVGEAVGVADFG